MVKEKMVNTYIGLLYGTERKGIHELIHELYDYRFFDMPASKKYHGNWKGGLVEHSLNVYGCLGDKELSRDTRIITSLLHDIDKMFKYSDYKHLLEFKGDVHPNDGISFIKQYIRLTKLEEAMIKYHHGLYGTFEFFKDAKENKGTYSQKEYCDMVRKYPQILLLHHADNESANVDGI